jgi:hypothetical protein
MAGRRHHYLPRFLQRPFAHRQNGKEFYVYAHHRVRGSYPTNVMNLGQERDFYGGPDDTALDDEITQGEQQLAMTVHKLNAGEEVPIENIASLIAALSFRTKTMRKALTDLIPPMMEAGRAYMLEGRQLQDKLHQSLHDPKKRKDLIYKQIREQMGHLGREQQTKMYALMLPKWKILVQENEDRMLAQARNWVAVALEHLTEKASEIGDGAFLKALAKEPNMPERAKRLATEMVFEVWDAPEGECFILGDCSTVGLFSDGKPRLALGNIDEDIEMEIVFLPISLSRCVVARKPSAIRSVGVSELNGLSASASLEFFISAQQDGPQMAELRGAIGTIDPIATWEEIAQALTLD